MKRIPKGIYTREFRIDAVKLVTEGGLSVLETCKRLSLPKSTIANWVRAYKSGKLGEVSRL
jgi:transposase-like protein